VICWNKKPSWKEAVINIGSFAEPQREFSEFHRAKVFLKWGKYEH